MPDTGPGMACSCCCTTTMATLKHRAFPSVRARCGRGCSAGRSPEGVPRRPLRHGSRERLVVLFVASPNRLRGTFSRIVSVVLGPELNLVGDEAFLDDFSRTCPPGSSTRRIHRTCVMPGPGSTGRRTGCAWGHPHSLLPAGPGVARRTRGWAAQRRCADLHFECRPPHGAGDDGHRTHDLRERNRGAPRVRARAQVIPLGVDTGRFHPPSPEKRLARREGLGIEHDEVTVLFVGRFSHHTKGHPFPMFAAPRPGGPRDRGGGSVLSGWAHNQAVFQAFLEGAVAFAPTVRVTFVDGTRSDIRHAVWHAADIFCSLSDNIQETFGLVIVEAMATGLPIVASDWTGTATW